MFEMIFQEAQRARGCFMSPNQPRSEAESNTLSIIIKYVISFLRYSGYFSLL